MPYLGFLGKNFIKRLSYLKLPPLNLSNCKILRKTKIPKFGTKNALFEYFWAGIFFKRLLSYLKSAPSSLSKMSL